MPTYEYECAACGHCFEEFQQMSDKPLKTCPACRRRKLRRLIGSGAAVLFKGSGFYQTDHRPKEYREKAKAEQGKAEQGKAERPCSSCAKSETCKTKPKD